MKKVIHTIKNILIADEVKSPGISDDIDLINKINLRGVPVISEVELFLDIRKQRLLLSQEVRKTTTTLLLGHILKMLVMMF